MATFLSLGAILNGIMLYKNLLANANAKLATYLLVRGTS